MNQSLTRLFPRLSKIKPWIAVSGTIAVLLLGYYVILGTQYLKASGQVKTLSEQVRQPALQPQQQIPDSAALTAEFETQKQTLEQLRRSFKYPAVDDLLLLISDTAQENRVTVSSLTVVDAQSKVKDGIRFQVQPVSISIQGQTEDIYRFLANLSQKVLVVTVSRLNMAGLGQTPSAQAQLLFHLSPEYIAGS